MKRLKRFMIGTLSVIIITLQLSPTMVFADTDYSIYKSSCISRMLEIQSFAADSTNGQYGLLSNLKYLSEYAMRLDYLATYADNLNVSGKELTSLLKSFKSMSSDFNSKYNNDSSKFIKFEVKYSALKDKGDISTWVRNSFLTEDVINYLKILLADSITQYDGCSDEQIRQRGGVLFSAIYTTIYDIKEEEYSINTITPDDSEYSIASTDGTKVLHSQLDELLNNDSYGKFLQIGQDIANSDGNSDLLMIDYSKTDFIENLADVVSTSSGLQIPEEPELSLAYLAILSCSAVYTPLQSYVGGSEFTAALSSLCADDTVAEELVSFYNATKDFRKPLYKRKLDDEGKPTGPAELITIQEFFNDITNETSGSLCTIEGQLTFNTEINGWLYMDETYYDAGTIFKDDYSSLENNENSSIDGSDTTSSEDDSNDDSADDNDAEANNKITTDSLKALRKLNLLISADAAADEDTKSTVLDTTSALPSSKTITDEDRMTGAVYLYGAEKLRIVDNMTTILMNNILQNSVYLSNIENRNTRYLYLNTYGDIVTDDNLVIFPGVANPMLYKEDSTYNPYTVAFMNAYPTVLNNTASFQLATKDDIGKYLIMLKSTDESSSTIAKKVSKFNDDATYISKASDYSFTACKTTSINTVDPVAPVSAATIEPIFTTNTYETFNLFNIRRVIFGMSSNWDADNSNLYSYTPLVFGNGLNVDGVAIFPYIVREDNNYTIASTIAQNMYDSLTQDHVSSKVHNVGKLSDNWILHYIIMSGLGGTNNPGAYSNDVLSSYDSYVSASADRKGKTITDISKNIFSTTTDVDGVIGMRSAYQDVMLGNTFQFIKSNWIIFFAILLLILIIAFAKMKRDLLQTITALVVGCFTAYAFVAVIPSYLPSVFNIFINNISDNFTYEILATKAEFNDASGATAVKIDSDGTQEFNTASITLYKASNKQLDEFYNRFNIEPSEVVGGKIYPINTDSGLFVEGDSIKINTDLLLSTLHIYAENNKGDNIYKFTSKKTVSSNTDYYVPYYQIVDAFIGKLNKVAGVYAIPRGTTMYASGEDKENYIVYSYVNSEPFLTPGNYGKHYLVDAISQKIDPDGTANETNEKLAKKLDSTFGNNADWLGVSEIFLNIQDYKDTLWAKTMQKNNYYDEEWNINKSKIEDLVTYINFQTKDFVFKMENQIGSLSDDVMIKIIALRALIAFTQEVSEAGSWLYPYSINYEELSLNDVLISAFVEDYDMFVALDMNVIDYIYREHGMLNLIFFDVLVVLMFLIVHVIRLLVSVMYLLLGVLVLLKLLSNGDIKLPIKGYLKCSAIVMVCATLLCVGICITREMNKSVIAIYVMIAIVMFIIYLLCFLITSLVVNIADLGNQSINAKLEAGLDRLKGKGRDIVVHTTNVVTHNDNGNHQTDNSRYSMNADVSLFHRRPTVYYNRMPGDYQNNNRSNQYYDDYLAESNNTIDKYSLDSEMPDNNRSYSNTTVLDDLTSTENEVDVYDADIVKELDNIDD